MIRSSVDLPAPFSPTTPILAPWKNERLMLRSTTFSPKVRPILRIS